ncbi:hypothetical protein DIURU_003148 [Diutina rugosa]|uniref:Uncharacterized protein n=1 Tax=Diutina rugosa TaxID=5481 RepID=A0A642UMA6_DIURU|nr:uncharacterized protein DIURU_003148 [Diutina rugosa]KAA8901620.1 hypothetical protein DIURU_003148 [Diutina rugosa]
MSLPTTLAQRIDSEQQAQQFVQRHPSAIFIADAGTAYGIVDPAKLVEFNRQHGVASDEVSELVAKEKEVLEQLLK